MLKKHMILLTSLLVAVSFSLAQEKASQQPVVKKTPIKQTSAASGKDMYGQYCAPCHGIDGKGAGPAASSMKTMPSDLTQLARQHDGKYPANSVASTLKFGIGPASHGSADMPVWGPLFKSLDKFHESVVQQRISNLVTYLDSIQVK